jgi:hypothetical protein
MMPHKKYESSLFLSCLFWFAGFSPITRQFHMTPTSFLGLPNMTYSWPIRIPISWSPGSLERNLREAFGATRPLSDLLAWRDRSEHLHRNRPYPFRSPHFGVSFALAPEHRLTMRPRAVSCPFTIDSGTLWMMLTPSYNKSENMMPRGEALPVRRRGMRSLQRAGLAV